MEDFPWKKSLPSVTQKVSSHVRALCRSGFRGDFARADWKGHWNQRCQLFFLYVTLPKLIHMEPTKSMEAPSKESPGLQGEACLGVVESRRKAEKLIFDRVHKPTMNKTNRNKLCCAFPSQAAIICWVVAT